MTKQPPYYMQTDSRWKSVPYAVKGESSTIGSAGCGPTACAMAISALLGREVLPPEVAKWLKAKGYKAKNQGTYYSGIAAVMKHYGVTATQITGDSVYHKPKATAHTKALKALQDGNLVIACMGKGIWTSSGHFVLAWKVDTSRVYINDPASTKAMRMCNLISTWQNEVKHYWIVGAAKAQPEAQPQPEPKKEVDDEVIEEKKMNILGRERVIPTIFKGNMNFGSVRAVCEAMGFKVDSTGSVPSVAMEGIKVKVDGLGHVLPGINVDGTVYLPVRRVAELVGCEAEWQDGAVVLK